jgi:hypothetical protein
LLVEHAGDVLPSYCELRTRRYAFVAYRTGERELYDLERDPYELHNLVADGGHEATIARLQRRLARLCDPPPPGLSPQLLSSDSSSLGSEVARVLADAL